MANSLDCDVAVIGSGAGGLAAAVSLAQSGLKTIVFEQHYVPGGWCHSFQLGGYRFSPGVHYVGKLEPGGRLRQVYEGLGVSQDLEFCELNPDGYDHMLVGGERFDIPKGRERYAERLKARFPAEAEGIDRFISTCHRLGAQLDALGDIRGVRDVAALPFRARTVAQWGLRSAESLINAHAKDPLLRAILAGQSGDHGLPPSMAPAPVHAAVVAHYLDGAYYPRGGGFALPRAFVRALRRAGGELRLRAPVARILLEGKKAVGLKLADGTEVRAKHVVSNADPGVTFGKLIGTENLSRRLARRLSRTRWSVSAISLFAALDVDARALGLDSGNYWWYQDADVDGVYKKGLEPWGRELQSVPGFFLTVTTLKDPTKHQRGKHTIEAFTFVGRDAFREWAETRCGERPEAYRALKAELIERMLDAVERIIPGVRGKVAFADLGTPLTNEHFVAATQGNLYGTNKTIDQVGPWAYQAETEFEGLSLCGASTLSHGVLGATMSGLDASRRILGCRVNELLTKKGPPIRIYPSEDLSAWPEELQRRAARSPEPVA